MKKYNPPLLDIYVVVEDIIVTSGDEPTTVADNDIFVAF